MLSFLRGGKSTRATERDPELIALFFQLLVRCTGYDDKTCLIQEFSKHSKFLLNAREFTKGFQTLSYSSERQTFIQLLVDRCMENLNQEQFENVSKELFDGDLLGKLCKIAPPLSVKSLRTSLRAQELIANCSSVDVSARLSEWMEETASIGERDFEAVVLPKLVSSGFDQRQVQEFRSLQTAEMNEILAKNTVDDTFTIKYDSKKQRHLHNLVLRIIQMPCWYSHSSHGVNETQTITLTKRCA